VISDRADVSPLAKIGNNVKIGSFAVIGAGVELGDDCEVAPHVVIQGPSKIGRNNKFYQFCSIGADAQDKKFQGEDAHLEIGDNNLFREGCTVHRGTAHGGYLTKIGNNNLFMVNTHVAHDCIVGNNVIFSNSATIAGHVTIQDSVNLGGFVAVQQFCIIGAHCFCAGGSMITKDVAPYTKVSGYPPQSYGLNTVGLERRGYNDEVLLALKHAYKTIFRKNLTVKQALAEIEELIQNFEDVAFFADFIANSVHGIVR